MFLWALFRSDKLYGFLAASCGSFLECLMFANFGAVLTTVKWAVHCSIFLCVVFDLSGNFFNIFFPF